MAPKPSFKNASKETTKIVEAFLKKNRVSLLGVPSYDFYGIYYDLKPWESEVFVDELEVRDAIKQIQEKEKVAHDKKLRASPPLEVWVMAFHTHNMVGSISHVSGGDAFWFTEKECQDEINTMKSWIGMGDRSQYRPLKLVYGPKKVD